MAWQPNASIDSLKRRAQLLALLRSFMAERGIWEVETPIMARFGVSDLHLSNIKAEFRQQNFYLQTSPEYHMKRLLAAGSGSIYYLGKVFRDDELGRWHNPEFTMLEWYQTGIDHLQLIAELDSLLQRVLSTKPLQKITYKRLFEEVLGQRLDDASVAGLREIAYQKLGHHVFQDHEASFDDYLHLLMSHCIEPVLAELEHPVAVYGFPASQACLARIEPDGTAARFEIYYKGLELANGFYELACVEEQKQRFAEDNAARKARGFPEIDLDPYFLEALGQGLPDCSGVALGVDRLCALLLESNSLAEVMAFTVDRA